jgi:protein subunit release factor A
MDPNVPKYVISGAERRKLKKEYNKLKSFLKTFWYYHNLDKDMCKAFEIPTRTDGRFPMTDEMAETIYRKKEVEALELEKKLSEILPN